MSAPANNSKCVETTGGAAVSINTAIATAEADGWELRWSIAKPSSSNVLLFFQKPAPPP